MNSILIGLNSEFSNETTYDVFVSTCDPVSWQIVANDISYDDFPVSVGLDTYGVTEFVGVTEIDGVFEGVGVGDEVIPQSYISNVQHST